MEQKHSSPRINMPFGIAFPENTLPIPANAIMLEGSIPFMEAIELGILDITLSHYKRKKAPRSQTVKPAVKIKLKNQPKNRRRNQASRSRSTQRTSNPLDRVIYVEHRNCARAAQSNDAIHCWRFNPYWEFNKVAGLRTIHCAYAASRP